MSPVKSVLFSALLATVGSAAAASGGSHWGYSGHTGPQHWGELEPSYRLCSEGKNQSPINITGFVEANLPPIQFDYHVAASEILNNGHTVQANFPAGNSIVVSGHRFELKQIHFHTPSENHIDGQSYPLEGHMVHADSEGNLAVVALMYAQGDENHALARLWEELPDKAGERESLKEQVSASDLLPGTTDYYRFNGSLTTPPCSEGVWWLVMKHPQSISEEQVEAFAEAVHHANNRPVQPANARPVLR